MTRYTDLNLKHDLEDRGPAMADHMDSIPSYHTPKERQLAVILPCLHRLREGL